MVMRHQGEPPVMTGPWPARVVPSDPDDACLATRKDLNGHGGASVVSLTQPEARRNPQ